ncbi:hypothetical protein KFK09_023065 [Dendrobium nobile]|uniref:Retrotransposon gag domain-containing protein n=1 Tax=Dendrobium nobile TaxID=94219 RepID=A0A8T3AL88_DENNO|nr:hypothetical protein KFK09_023065 [Dendrobium nobile]
MQYEAEFTALARYASHLIPTAEEKCYRFLHGLNRELRHPLVPFRIHEFFELVERARLIEIDLTTPVSKHDDIRRRRDEVRRDESCRDRDREKRSRYGDSKGSALGSASVVSSGGFSACIHCGRRHAGLGGRTDSGIGQQRMIGSRAYTERSVNRMIDRADRDGQRETVAPRPPALPLVVPCIYSLQHHEDQQRPESSTGSSWTMSRSSRPINVKLSSEEDRPGRYLDRPRTIRNDKNPESWGFYRPRSNKYRPEKSSWTIGFCSHRPGRWADWPGRSVREREGIKEKNQISEPVERFSSVAAVERIVDLAGLRTLFLFSEMLSFDRFTLRIVRAREQEIEVDQDPQEREREGIKEKSQILEPAERFSSIAAVERIVDLAVRAREQEIEVDQDHQVFVLLEI